MNKIAIKNYAIWARNTLIEAVKRRGYAIAHEETDHVFDFETGKLDYPLPQGFHVVTPSGCEPEKLARCFWRGFGNDEREPFENWADRVAGAGEDDMALLQETAETPEQRRRPWISSAGT